MTGGRLAGRRALVTGGSSGIGLAVIGRLRAEGADAVAVDQMPPAPARGEAIPYLRADVSDAGQVSSAIRSAAALLGGPPDILVSAAGIYQIRPLLDLRPDEWDQTLAVNLRGAFLTGQAVAAGLIEAGLPGAIVNLGSTAALVADASEPTGHYNASKAGVVALTRQMAAEWAPYQIRANVVCPGVIDTPMLRLMDDPAAGQAYLRASVPLARLGTAAEVAAVIAFLVSPDAAYLTGTVIPVDGGSTAV